MELLRQEYWSGLPFPNLGDLPNPGTRPSTLVSPALARGFFNTPQPGKPEYQSKLVSIIAVVVLLLCHVQLLWPHGLQHASIPCFSTVLPCSPRACSNLCLSSRWCHPTISSSVILFSYCLRSFPASGSFQMSWLFASGSQSIGASTSASVLPINIQGWFTLGLTGWISLQSMRLSRVFSTTTV